MRRRRGAGRIAITVLAGAVAAVMAPGVGAVAVPVPTVPVPDVVEVVPAAPGSAAAEVSFSDVPPGHPFHDAIRFVASEGIAGGYPDGTFRPSGTVSRQAMAAFLFRAFGPEGWVPPATASFSDVAVSSPFFTAIEWAAAAGIADGYGDGTFRPSAPVTRQAMAAFLYRVGLDTFFPLPPTATFSDVPASHPFFRPIEWLAEWGISVGYADGTFLPGATVSRQAMAQFLMVTRSVLPGRAGIAPVASGDGFQLAAWQGAVYAWGLNTSGQLGLGDVVNRSTPQRVDDVTNVIAVAAGGAHSLALTATGDVYSWGAGESYQLGLGLPGDRPEPGKIVLTERIVAIDAGFHHSMALGASGTVYTWGSDDSGQQGRGLGVAAPFPRGVTLPLSSAIAAGSFHSLAVGVTGQVHAWGANGSGQLGDGTTTRRDTPVPVAGLSDVAGLAGGEQHTLALTRSGAIHAWGSNTHGQLGLPATTPGVSVPGPVPGTGEARRVAAGLLHSLAIYPGWSTGIPQNGYAWGWNAFGTVGDDGITDVFSPHELAIPAPLIGIDGSVVNSVAMSRDGRVFVWGDNSYGQIGDGTTDPRLLPTEVSLP